MDVLHAVENDPPNFLQTLEWPHSADCCPLYKNVTLRQQLDSLETLNSFVHHSFPWNCSYLQGTPVRSDDPLPSLDEPLLVRNDVPDLDYVAGNSIVQDLDRLSNVHASSEQFDQVAGFEYDIRVIRFPGRPYRHGTADQV